MLDLGGKLQVEFVAALSDIDDSSKTEKNYYE